MQTGDDCQGSGTSSSADNHLSAKMPNRGGVGGVGRSGQGWKRNNCFGLGHAQFEVFVENSC